jgi:arylformamidase
VRLIGIDYLSIQRYGDDPETHRVLMDAGVIIIEGLNLTGVSAGEYELLCLPLLLEGAEGAPARVVLRSLDGHSR